MNDTFNKVSVAPVNNKGHIDINSFTKGQLTAYYELIRFINDPYNPNDCKRALVGPAGTGKTYLLKALIKNCNISYSLIKLGAPTHKACRVIRESINMTNIKVNSMASDLGFRPNYDSSKFDIKNPPFDSKGRSKILEDKPKLYIMDESSMIGRGELHYLNKFCSSVQCKIIFVGDSYQLPPVNEKYSPAFKGVKTYELTEIVRQGDDNPVSKLLNILRQDIKNRTFHFLEYISNHRSEFNEDNTKGYQVLFPSEFQRMVGINFSDEQYVTNIELAKVVAYTNDCVSNWNKFIRNSIIKDAEKSILNKNDLILSGITIVNNFNDTIIINSEEYIIHDIVNYTHPRYNIKGFLVKFQAIHGGVISSPLFVVDHSDIYSIQMYYKVSNELIDAAKNASSSTRVQKWKDYYAFKESCLILVNVKNKMGETLVNRNIDYGFAITSHKSQGSTYDTVFVEVNDIVYDKNGYPYADAEEINRRLYVACSRCKNKLYLNFGRE